MLVQYKRNKRLVCYNPHNLVTIEKYEPIQQPHGPFASCGGCPYAGHGFICYTSEGNCLKGNLAKVKNQEKAV